MKNNILNLELNKILSRESLNSFNNIMDLEKLI